MEKYYYLFIDIASILFPLLFSFSSGANFSKKWRYLWPSIASTALIFIAWDNWFTGMGVWGFNPRYLCGIYFFHLPLEEVLFFVCIPYACVFTYEAVNYFRRLNSNIDYARRTTWILIAVLLIVGLINYDKWYTSVTFLSTAIYLIILVVAVKPTYLGKFYVAYGFILIPFFIVNGILTGTGLPEPVVWYNNEENLGVRLLTIPFEDTFYGMLLILMNVSIFEFLQKRNSSEYKR